jgi:c-di-GMP-binding flagellar brake protein YcgR
MYHLLRIAHRKSCRVPVSIKVQGQAKETPFTGYGENISASGMLFHSDTVLFEGDRVTCTFYLADSTHISTKAEVVRVIEKKTEHDTNGYGIRFIDLSSKFSIALEAFAEQEGRNA